MAFVSANALWLAFVLVVALHSLCARRVVVVLVHEAAQNAAAVLQVVMSLPLRPTRELWCGSRVTTRCDEFGRSCVGQLRVFRC